MGQPPPTWNFIELLRPPGDLTLSPHQKFLLELDQIKPSWQITTS